MNSRRLNLHRRTNHGKALPLLLVAMALILATALVLIVGVGKTTPVTHTTPEVQPMSFQIVGSQGDSLGEFQQPRGVTGLADGSFVVVDRSARVQHFSADGKPLGVWSMKDHAFGNPKSICAMPDGNLLVCDTHYGRVLEMSVKGDIIKQWGGPGTAPGEFTHPLAACINTKLGLAYVAEYHANNDRVQVFKLDGTFVKAFGSFGSDAGQFMRPSGITLDHDGNVYVADACNHRIQKFDGDGKLLQMFGKMGTAEGDLRYPYDIAFGEELSDLANASSAKRGVLYVAEFNNMRVSVFDTDGKFVRTIGGPGAGKEQFANPWSLTVDVKGRLLVSDTGNHRVQMFDFSRPAMTVATAHSAGEPVSGSKQ